MRPIFRNSLLSLAVALTPFGAAAQQVKLSALGAQTTPYFGPGLMYCESGTNAYSCTINGLAATIAGGTYSGAFTTLSAASGAALFSATGSLRQAPSTAFAAGTVPGIYQTYAATGSAGTATSAAINVLNLTSDNLAVSGAPSSASLALLSVYDLAFGGSAATGGRIAGDFDITQTAATEGSHAFRDYVGLHGTIQSTSGDGGTLGSEKGSYFGGWDSAVLSTAAVHTVALTGREIDIEVDAGSSTLYKTGLQIGEIAGDATAGSVVDTDIWIFNVSGTPGMKNGILFGRADGFGGTGVATVGTALQFATETATIANGIDLTGGGKLTITGYAWQSPGTLIDGKGQFSSTGSSSDGFFSNGTKSGAGFQDSSSTPYGLVLNGTYSTAALYFNGKPDFHYAGGTTCTDSGSIAVLINGVAHSINYC